MPQERFIFKKRVFIPLILLLIVLVFVALSRERQNVTQESGIISIGIEDLQTLDEDQQTYEEEAYDFSLINQDGKNIRLSDFRDKVVLITFIYTQCQLPNMCPLVTRKMEEVQYYMDDAQSEKLVLMTITFDPKYDDPEVMKEYAEAYVGVLKRFGS